MQILKVLVGSRAHGLATPTSDYDYRGVFLHRTSSVLSLNARLKDTGWVEADKSKGEKDDDTSWELRHFLELALYCNPSVLEVFTAPLVSSSPDGDAVRSLFPCIWNPIGVRDSFIGYGQNQRKKFLDDKDQRGHKYAVAYLRTLVQGYYLLKDGVLLSDMSQVGVEYDILKRWREGRMTKGEVIDTTSSWEAMVILAAAECDHTPQPGRVNDFLLDVRRRFW
jgi:predicted nucleotidyltransferase